eukprot:CAMPEP_0113588324 /NCGR_PEP_ID=MMETSP0015_2-20120614/35443_1 /TAXON_ID=2838 /ORGANISM="Odontella" /LENGTH=724 /DNA_ID=CAMNT_0000494167 /DNA_START=99 /DNA_END=2270 /DNA_ORIENTATION=+ /assembly_acc=CAM_ASM_000160
MVPPVGAVGSSSRRRGGGTYSDIPDASDGDDFNPFAVDIPPQAPSATAAAGGYARPPGSDDNSGDDDPFWDGDERDQLGSQAETGRKPSGTPRKNGGGGGLAVRAGGATSVYVDDDSMSEEADPFGERRRGRRFRRADLARLNQAGDVGLRGCWMYAVLALLAAAAVMIGMQKEKRAGIANRVKHSPTEGMARPGDDDDEYDPYGGGDDDDAYEKEEEAGKKASGASAAAGADGDESASPASVDKVAYGAIHHRDPTAETREHDPFHLSESPWYGSIFAPPPFPAFADDIGGAGDEGFGPGGNNLGFAQNPDIHNGTVVFCSEGDLYLTSLPPGALEGGDDGEMKLPPLPSVKLTTTVGNVLTPKINPQYPYLVAFTATYTGVREAYLMDLRPGRRSLPSVRLTYFDSVYGCERIAGWDDDGQTLIVVAGNDRVGMEDTRLYRISIVRPKGGGGASSVSVGGVEPLPLSQATEYARDPAWRKSRCYYFTRYKQSSSTARYVGGTAESIWAWCANKERAIEFTHDYAGTNKSPRLYLLPPPGGSGSPKPFLFFLSDRAENDGGETSEEAKERNYGLFKAVNDDWRPGTMDLWALPVLAQWQMYPRNGVVNLGRPVRLTSVSCEFDGVPLSEYAIDAASGDVVLRIGADLHLIPREEVAAKLQGGNRRRTRETRRREEEEEEEEGEEEEPPTTTTAKTQPKWNPKTANEAKAAPNANAKAAEEVET